MLLIIELFFTPFQLLTVVFVLSDVRNWKRNSILILAIGYFLALGGIMTGSRARIALEPWFCISVGLVLARLVFWLKNMYPVSFVGKNDAVLRIGEM
jgi:hypothetical protein